MNELVMQIILGCASLIITACVGFATKEVTKWLAEKQLLDDVTNAVNYAEQMYKIGDITKEQRKAQALLFLADLGIKIPEQVADMLIESILGGINTALGKTAEVD